MTKTGDTLSGRQRNRALLARQHLLARVDMSAEQMIEHLVGMQAQSPRNPYIALWSRLAEFTAPDLETLIKDRRALRLPVMRTTLHLVTARDAVIMWPVMQPVLARVFGSQKRWPRALEGLDMAALLADGRKLLELQPRTASELSLALGANWDADHEALASAVHYLTPAVQVPPRGLWSSTGRATWTTLEKYLGRQLVPATDTQRDALVLRYLAAFGPASVPDIGTWSGLTGVREIVERLRPRLVTFPGEDGRELLDLPDAPRPPADTPAPPRFMPEYDNLGLSHKDRSHVIPPQAAGRVTGFVGTFMVDGYLRGQWRVGVVRDVATIEVDAFWPLSSGEGGEVGGEALNLVRWHSPGAARHDVAFGPLRKRR